MRARLAVALVGARNPSNIGAAARAMRDFGFSDLRFVNDYTAPFEAAQLEATKSAVGAADVMKSARAVCLRRGRARGLHAEHCNHRNWWATTIATSAAARRGSPADHHRAGQTKLKDRSSLRLRKNGAHQRAAESLPDACEHPDVCSVGCTPSVDESGPGSRSMPVRTRTRRVRRRERLFPPFTRHRSLQTRARRLTQMLVERNGGYRTIRGDFPRMHANMSCASSQCSWARVRTKRPHGWDFYGRSCALQRKTLRAEKPRSAGFRTPIRFGSTTDPTNG